MHSDHIFHSNTDPSRFDREVSAWRRLWEARSAIIFVYLFRCAFAFSLSWPFADRLGVSAHRHPSIAQTPDGQSVLLFIERLRQLLPTIREQLLLAMGISLLYFLLVPLISMIWIHAIDNPSSLRTSVLKAARCYHASLLISLSFLFALVSSIALFFGLGWLVHCGHWFIHDDRMRDIFGFSMVIPALLIILYLMIFVDMARSALCKNHHVSLAIKLGLSAALRATAIFAFLFWFGSAAIITSVCGLLFVFQEDGLIQSFCSSFILLEIIAIARTFLRGRWLITAQNLVHEINNRGIKNELAHEL